jgi:ribonucleoside-diphosphate reductase alpha chain
LASIALNRFVKPADKDKEPYYDFEGLHAVTKVITYNLNRIIDINYYPTEKTKKSNFRHRPIGIGVQGLADVFMMMNYAFASDESKELNKQIFETIYHAALESSMELAKLHGPYETFQGSPASEGILQFDMWEYDPGTTRYDWTALKASIVEHGLRNSLLLAPMPTASTSQILGNNEAFEPITSNIYTRRTMAGEFIVMNKYLMKELIEMGLWNERLKNNIIANRGSIQHLMQLSEHVRNKYKTVWEIPMKDVIDMSADRGVFICQSQSLNLWMEEPNYKSLTSMHFYAWSKGLKTGLYYLRRADLCRALQAKGRGGYCHAHRRLRDRPGRRSVWPVCQRRRIGPGTEPGRRGGA